MKRRRIIGPGDRGVALLIVLLVTALLMALIFEFAYGTRVSLFAAVNYRDGVRASYLARSGISFAGKVLADHLKNGRRQENLAQPEWQVVPIVSEGDTVLQVRWEDEKGKINVANPRTQTTHDRLEALFGLKGVNLAVIDAMAERVLKHGPFRLLTELHEVMSDEEFAKVRDLVTVHSGTDLIDVNTAPQEVLECIGIPASGASMLIEQRAREPYRDKTVLQQRYGITTTTYGQLDVSSDVFLVQAHATVGGFTKQAEAVIQRTAAGGFTILYWRML